MKQVHLAIHTFGNYGKDLLGVYKTHKAAVKATRRYIRATFGPGHTKGIKLDADWCEIDDHGYPHQFDWSVWDVIG
jgi:hypothetical protein